MICTKVFISVFDAQPFSFAAVSSMAFKWSGIRRVVRKFSSLAGIEIGVYDLFRRNASLIASKIRFDFNTPVSADRLSKALSSGGASLTVIFGILSPPKNTSII